MIYEFAVCRAYFNKRDDPAGCWSLDYGPGTPEIVVKRISLLDVDTVKTAEDFTQHGPDGVSAWIAMQNVVGHLYADGHMVIRPAN